MRRFFRTAFEEWKLIWLDKASMLLLVVAVILYSFYYPVPYMNQTVSKVPAGVVDLDQSAKSRELVRMASATQAVEVAQVFTDLESAKVAMAKGEIYGFMLIPKDMERNLSRGENVTVGIYTHGAYVMLHSAIGTAFATCVATMNAPIKVKRFVAQRGMSLAEAKSARDPIPLRLNAMFNGVGGYANYIVPTVLVLILQQTIIIGVCTLGGPRKNRKYLKQFARPDIEGAPFLTRYFGRSLGLFLHEALMLSMVHFVVYATFGFPQRLGSYAALAAFGACFLITEIAFGMFLSLLFARRESPMQLFLFSSIPFLFLSGFSWPRASMPQALELVSNLVPSTFAIPAWLSLEQMGASLPELLPSLQNLLFQALAYFLLGCALGSWLERNERHEGDY